MARRHSRTAGRGVQQVRRPLLRSRGGGAGAMPRKDGWAGLQRQRRPGIRALRPAWRTAQLPAQRRPLQSQQCRPRLAAAAQSHAASTARCRCVTLQAVHRRAGRAAHLQELADVAVHQERVGLEEEHPLHAVQLAPELRRLEQGVQGGHGQLVGVQLAVLQTGAGLSWFGLGLGVCGVCGVCSVCGGVHTFQRAWAERGLVSGAAVRGRPCWVLHPRWLGAGTARPAGSPGMRAPVRLRCDPRPASCHRTLTLPTDASTSLTNAAFDLPWYTMLRGVGTGQRGLGLGLLDSGATSGRGRSCEAGQPTGLGRQLSGAGRGDASRTGGCLTDRAAHSDHSSPRWCITFFTTYSKAAVTGHRPGEEVGLERWECAQHPPARSNGGRAVGTAGPIPTRKLPGHTAP